MHLIIFISLLLDGTTGWWFLGTIEHVNIPTSSGRGGAGVTYTVLYEDGGRDRKKPESSIHLATSPEAHGIMKEQDEQNHEQPEETHEQREGSDEEDQEIMDGTSEFSRSDTVDLTGAHAEISNPSRRRKDDAYKNYLLKLTQISKGKGQVSSSTVMNKLTNSSAFDPMLENWDIDLKKKELQSLLKGSGWEFDKEPTTSNRSIIYSCGLKGYKSVNTKMVTVFFCCATQSCYDKSAHATPLHGYQFYG